ncbi:MAG: glycosyltransferase family 4 protein [Anaerolineae bacterium]|nr:glycosyltransferase family 4 protein [Anaerolineae bacterium]
MRIVLVSGEFPPMQGGVGDYTREMARAFTTQGHEVTVITCASLAEHYAGGSGEPWRVLPVVRGWGLSCWRSVLRTVRQLRPDVVNIQYQAAAYHMRVPAVNLLPLAVHRLRHAPAVVVTYHDLKPPYLFPKAGRLREWAVRLIANLSDAAVVTNAEDMETARHWPSKAPTARTSVHQVPIGSNIPVAPPPGFQRVSWRERHSYGPRQFIWGYFGFLNESKGGDTLIRALGEAPEEHVLLMIGGRVGSSDPTNRAYAERIEALIAGLGLADRVAWTGYVAQPEVSASLLGCDAIVLPYRDGVSFRRGSLHAALAHGCAIVTTKPRVPLPELRHEESVLLVEPDAPRALSEALVRLQHDPMLRERLAAGAAVVARGFSWEQIARRTVDEVYVPAVARRRARGAGGRTASGG